MRKNYSLFFFALVFFWSLKSSAQQPQDVGEWSDPIPFNLVPVAVANLPDGRLLTWSSRFRESRFDAADGFTYTEIYDPSVGPNGQAMGLRITDNNHNMFCPGINNLADGRILVAGGGSAPRTTIYDPQTENWISSDNMNVARAYQGNVTLANGEVFTIGGQWDGGSNGKIGEVWTPENGWKSLPGIPMEILFNNNDLSGGHNRPADHAWVWGAPNGKVFHAGPSEDMHWLDINGNGSYTFARKRANDPYSISGTTVMYDIGKILKVGGAINYGGGAPASEKSYIIDINDENNVLVTSTANDIAFSRTHHNSIVLPNGEVLIVGGLSTARTFFDGGSRFQAEIWNPETNSWRTVAGMQVPRNYHSVSILMMDGRVFSGGGGLCGGCSVNHEDAEIYSPPYLFDANGNLADRPEISAPPTAQYNQTFQVQSDDTIEAFSFIRMSSATHSVNNEQRRVPVSFSRNGNTYSLNMPGANVMPPGYYMLFAMNQNGVPSMAEAVQVLKGVISVTGVELNPDTIELSEGRITSLTATISPSSASDQTVSWSSGDTNVATVDGEGKVTAVGLGTTIITVTTNDGGFTAQTSVTVVEGDGLCIANGTILMERYNGIGGTLLDALFNAPNFPDNPNSTQELNSLEIPTNVANNYGVRVSGYLCAPETGTYYFWVAGDDESRLNLSTDNDVSNVVTIASVPDWTSSREWNKFSQQKSVGIQLVQGLSYYIEAFMKEGSGGDNLAVGWRRPSEGNGSTPTEVIPGNVLSTTLQLAPINVTGVTVTPTTLDLIVGNNSSLTANVQPTNADDTTVIWTSSDESVATVDTNGQVTAVSEGSTIVTVTTNDGGFEATSSITVEREPVSVTGVTLDLATLDLIEGETGSLTATVSPSDADNPTVTWSSSDETVAVVDGNGEVTAVSEGTATIIVTTNDGGFEAQVEIVVSGIALPSGPTQSSPIMVDAETRRVWVVNPDNNTVSVLNADTMELIGEFAVAADPVSIAKDSQGNVWVTCRDAGVIQVLNPQGNLLNSLNLGRGSQPYGVVNDPLGEFLYVTLFASNKVLKINASNQNIVDEVSVFARPRAMAITSDGLQLFVTQFITENNQGKIAKINLTDFELDSDVTIEADTFSPNTSLEAKGIANYLGGIAIQHNSDKAWFTAKKDNTLTGAFKSGENLNFATTVRALVSSFSMETGEENVVGRVDIDNHNLPTGITVSPLGNYVFITMLTNNRIVVLDANNGLEVIRRDVGFAPSGMVVDPTNNRLFVKNFLSRSVHVFDADDLITQGNRTLPLLSEISTVSNELLSNQVLQGKQIFYNARDSRMTLQENADAGYISCASCHIDGTHDGQTWDFTQRGEGLRNTISLRGRAGTAHGNVHWTGNFDEIHDFENDIRFAFGGTGFMTDQDFFSENRENPLGGAKEGRSAELDALTAYIESLNTFDESPNKNADGTMTPEALQGKALFTTLQCATCHSGQAFTNSDRGLLYDIGTIGNGSGKRLGRDLQGFDVPTLRDVWATAPYLHDGSAATVKDAIARHAIGDNLSQNELDLLEAYVLQLDGFEAPATDGITFELQVPSTATLDESVLLSVSTDIPNIQEVIYYVDDVEIGRSSTSPYNLNFLPNVANNYCVYAKAVHQGMATISQNQTLTITGGDDNSGDDRLITLEGEDFVLVEDGSIGNYLPGFQGTGFLDLGGNNSFGEWQFQSDEEVTGSLTIVYTSSFVFNRLANVELNGEDLGEIEFSSSANCFSWQSIKLENINLQEGLNTIRVTMTSAFGGVDIDFLEIELPQVITSVAGVALEPVTLDLIEGQTANLTAIVSPLDADDLSVTWNSSDESVAIVDVNGQVTAVSEGSATITVRTNDGGFEATSTITVERATIPVTSVTLTPTSLTLTEGEMGSLTATVSPSDADDPTVTWSSSDENVATVDENGVVTAITEGTATITVRTNDGGLEVTAEVLVENPAPLQRPFITTWKTDNPGISSDNQIKIPTFPNETYDYYVDWGDGTTSDNVIGEITHTYNVPGTYTVSISGDFPRISFDIDEDSEKLLSIDQWGDINWSSMSSAFSTCRNLRILAEDAPNLSNVSSLRFMFAFATSLNDDISDWDISSITDMASMFSGASSFNQDISNWDVSNVTNMNFLFNQAASFNQNIAQWDVSKVEGMAGIFRLASSFNQNLGAWNVESVTNFGQAFSSSGLSNENYDKTLIGWSQLPSLQNGVQLDAPQNQYCQAEGARQSIIDNYNWIINDAGKAQDCETIIPVTGIFLDVTEGTVPVGFSGTITATVLPEDATNKTVIWTSSDENVATVDQNGFVVAVGPGEVIITATTEDGGFTAIVNGIVEGDDPEPIPVTGVTINPISLTLVEGGTSVLTATVSPSNADDATVTWESSDESIATVDGNGQVVAISEGTATITVTTNDGGFEATSTITVENAAIPVTGITVDPTTLTLTEGATAILIANIIPADADSPTVTWSSSDETIATVNDNGQVTALSVGTVTITATTNDGGFEANSSVTVEAEVSTVPVTGIVLDVSEGEVPVGFSGTITATVLPTDATDKRVVWRSSDENVGTVDQNGFVVAVGLGSVVITATTVDGGYSATVNGTVFESSSGLEVAWDGNQVLVATQPIVFPNPSDGRLNLDLRVYEEVGVNVSIFNNLQQKVFEVDFTDNHSVFEEVDASNLANGIYHVVFESDGERETQTIIISK